MKYTVTLCKCLLFALLLGGCSGSEIEEKTVDKENVKVKNKLLIPPISYKK
jgi:hypothetical protein